MSVIAHHISISLTGLVLIVWVLTLLPVVRAHPRVVRYRKNVHPPVLFFLFGMSILTAGIVRQENGVPGTFKGGGPVHGWQDVVVGCIVICCGVLLAIYNWRTSKHG